MNKESTSKALDNLKWLLAIIVFGIAVVGNSYFVEVAFLYRVLAVLALFIVGLVLIALTSFGSNALKLMKESRTEIRKVVWPTRMETTQTFMIVFGAGASSPTSILFIMLLTSSSDIGNGLSLVPPTKPETLGVD